jgi:hypothetical protein
MTQRRSRGARAAASTAVFLLLAVGVPAPAEAATVHYIAFAGGNAPDRLMDMVVAPDGAVIIVGVTLSEAFSATAGALNTSGGQIFVAKINGSGASYDFVARIGGSWYDGQPSAAVDRDGFIYIGGWSRDSHFPTTANAFSHDGGGSYLAKLTPNGTSLVFSTRIPGCEVEDLAVDAQGHAFLVGRTYPEGLPNAEPFPLTPGAYDVERRAGERAFMMKVAADGGSVAFSTYLDGNASWQEPAFERPLSTATAVAVDSNGNAFATGSSLAGFRWTVGPNSQSGDGEGIFIVKLAADGTRAIFSTGLGSGAGGEAGAIALDAAGAAYVAGNSPARIPAAVAAGAISVTGLAPFPETAGAFAGGDLVAGLFLAKLAPEGDRLEFAATFGGEGSSASGLALDNNGTAYIAGTARGFIPISPGAYDSELDPFDGFVMRVSADGTHLDESTYLGGDGLDTVEAVALMPDGAVAVAGNFASSVFAGPALQRLPVFDGAPGAPQTIGVAKLTLAPTSFISMGGLYDGASATIDGVPALRDTTHACTAGSTLHLHAQPPTAAPQGLRWTFLGWPADLGTDINVTCGPGTAYRPAWRLEALLTVTSAQFDPGILIDGTVYGGSYSEWVGVGLHHIQAPLVTSNAAGELAFVGWTPPGPRDRFEDVEGPVSLVPIYRPVTGPDFVLSPRQGYAQFFEHGQANVTLDAVGLHGFAGGPLTVRLLGAPRGLVGTCTPAALPVGGSCNFVIEGANFLPGGHYDLRIEAEAEGLHREAAIRLLVAYDMSGPDPLIVTRDELTGLSLAFLGIVSIAVLGVGLYVWRRHRAAR